jgi:hypothetical protein
MASSFVDKVTIFVRAGDGGDGAVSFTVRNMSRRADRTAATAAAAGMWFSLRTTGCRR